MPDKQDDMLSDETYEILPAEEIEELKEELKRMKEFEIAPSKKMQMNIIELNVKLDRMIKIFEEAMHELKVEGAEGLMERIRGLDNKLDELLEQNRTIAEGMVAIADLVTRQQKPKQELPPIPKPSPPGTPSPPGPPPRVPPPPK